MGFRATTEREINQAIAIGSQRLPGLSTLSYAARFWAAIRRLQSDCSANTFVLAQISGLSHADLYYYRGNSSRNLRSLFAASDLDKAAASLSRNNL